MTYIHAILVSALVIGFLLRSDIFVSTILLILLLFEIIWDYVAKRIPTFPRGILFLIKTTAFALTVVFLVYNSSHKLLDLAMSLWLLNALLGFIFLAYFPKN